MPGLVKIPGLVGGDCCRLRLQRARLRLGSTLCIGFSSLRGSFRPFFRSGGRWACGVIKWRRGRDSNPRYGYKPYTRFPGEPVRPLRHLSAFSNLYCHLPLSRLAQCPRRAAWRPKNSCQADNCIPDIQVKSPGMVAEIRKPGRHHSLRNRKIPQVRSPPFPRSTQWPRPVFIRSMYSGLTPFSIR